jgi:bifunctional DNA-binding transcriptional regulator/antitoxin component of YhaV-PrlF toxin-antitoxin module
MNKHVRISGSSIATSKGQTTIPKAMRDAIGITDGTKLDWVFEDGILKVTAKTRNIADYAGILGPVSNGRTATIEQMNDAIGEAVSERFRRKTAR